MTWIAIVYDFVDKLRELELAGDKRAVQRLAEFEKCHGPENIDRALKFERDLLVAARDDFELISPLEFTDLSRLQEDRHRCAHPSFSGGEPYQPSAELARLHLRNAVIHFLRHPPVQGKAALDRLLAETASEFFPTTSEDALVLFRKGPLARPREALVRSFIIVTAKNILRGKLQAPAFQQQCAALQAALGMHREVAERVLIETVSDLILGQADSELAYAIAALRRIPEIQSLLREDAVLRLRSYVSKMKLEETPGVFAAAMSLGSLRANAIARIAELSRGDVWPSPSRRPPRTRPLN
jgi:hypothetical protein